MVRRQSRSAVVPSLMASCVWQPLWLIRQGSVRVDCWRRRSIAPARSSALEMRCADAGLHLTVAFALLGRCRPDRSAINCGHDGSGCCVGEHLQSTTPAAATYRPRSDSVAPVAAASRGRGRVLAIRCGPNRISCGCPSTLRTSGRSRARPRVAGTLDALWGAYMRDAWPCRASQLAERLSF